MKFLAWVSGFFLGLSLALGLFIATSFIPSSDNWGGVISTGFIGILSLIASLKTSKTG